MASENYQESAFGCPICDIEFKVNERKRICTIPCGHVFHEKCLKRWFHVQMQEMRRSNCPKCRATTYESQMIRLFLHETDSNSTIDDSSDEAVATGNFDISMDDFNFDDIFIDDDTDDFIHETIEDITSSFREW